MNIKRAWLIAGHLVTLDVLPVERAERIGNDDGEPEVCAECAATVAACANDDVAAEICAECSALVDADYSVAIEE